MNLRDTQNTLFLITFILIIIAGVTLFFKITLATFILLVIAGVLYFFNKELAKIIRGI